MSARFNAASRTKNVAARKLEIEFKAVSAPDNSADFIASYKAASSARHAVANLFTIDVLPDFTPILMFVIFHCAQLIIKVDDRSQPKVTIHTMIMYCMTIIYGHFLVNDMYVRPSPSDYANEYHDTSYKAAFVEHLLGLPVPAFLEPLLKYFTCTTPEQMSNLVFCPSANGFHHKHFFGKFYPVNIFTSLHDITASLAANTRPAEILLRTFSDQVFVIKQLHNATDSPFVYNISHFFGAMFTQTPIATAANPATDEFAHPLRQYFDSVFNPVLFRDQQRRQALAPLMLQVPVFETFRYNPYDMLFAMTPFNSKEIMIVLSSVAASLNGSIPLLGSLAKTFDSATGQQILTHGYSMPAAPMFHHAKNVDYDNLDIDLVKGIKPTPCHPESVASKLKFLQPFDQTTVNHTFTLPTATCPDTHDPAGPGHPTITPGNVDLQLLRPITYTSPISANHLVPRKNEYILFDETLHFAPTVMVLNPTDNDTVSAWMTTAFGMVIESTEIDASAISMPAFDYTNGLQNVQFADSAANMNVSFRSTHFGDVRNTQGFFARKRVPVKENRFKSALLLVDFAKIYVPRPVLTVYDNLVANGLPGLTFRDNVTNILRTLSFLGQNLHTMRSASASDISPPHVPNGTIYLWSPYTYAPSDGEFEIKKNHFGYYDEIHTRYFLANPRSIFGTAPALIEVKHYRDAMPALSKH